MAWFFGARRRPEAAPERTDAQKALDHFRARYEASEARREKMGAYATMTRDDWARVLSAQARDRALRRC